MKELNMYIPIRDETSYMIKYYQYLFNKYWGSHTQVYFLGYKVPEIKLDENMHFVSLADKRGSDPKAWSKPLIDFFQSIEDEYFYFSLEDLLIIRPVDLELLEACKEMMNQSVGRIDLWNSVQFDPGRKGWVSFYKEHKGVNFCIQNQNPPPSVYRISCSNSIWNRRWFLKTLEPNWSTGDWETKANDGRNNNDGYDVLSTIDRWTPTVVHSLCKHWRGKLNLYGMLQTDKDFLKSISSPEEIENMISVGNAVTAVNVNYNDPIRTNAEMSLGFYGYQPNINDTSGVKIG
jgi:hypothetical protein